MRLINCSTLQLEEFFDYEIPLYVILSHTWEDEEVTFVDLPLDHAPSVSKKGYRKIQFTCRQALQDGFNYAWVDTCCIDKNSSAELSEAINSMFAWYEDSDLCYVYLSDVSKTNFDESFPKSRWFTRGWTLQELLAPGEVIFYDREWNELGTKSEYASWISEITLIDIRVLEARHFRLSLFCAAKRMSWASSRETTRTEDMAYCLLGIFGINMPLLYGEGERAFSRLQEEIMKKFNDHSILAWGLDPQIRHPLGLVPDVARCDTSEYRLLCSTLARSPQDFKGCRDLKYGAKSSHPFSMTNVGLQIQLPLVLLDNSKDRLYPCWIGLLNCLSGATSEHLGIPLYSYGVGDDSIGLMTRGVFLKDEVPCNTFIVGPRAAVRSILQKVTIIDSNEVKYVREDYWGYRHIIVNESQALRDIGYHVTNGTGQNIAKISGRRPYVCDPIWDQEKMLLTIEDVTRNEDLLSFCFESQWSRPKANFTVFMHTASRKALVRKGLSFTEGEKRTFYHYLDDQSQHDCADEIAIIDREGSPYKVVITIDEKRVYEWRIFEVNVDAVRVIAGGGMEEAS